MRMKLHVHAKQPIVIKELWILQCLLRQQREGKRDNVRNTGE